jgi:hypothetical protein
MKQYNENLRNMQNYIFNKNKKKTEDKPKVVKEKNDYEKFIDENFARERDILCKYFNELFVRWYMDDIVEGDDLIAYYCQNYSDVDLSKLNENLLNLAKHLVAWSPESAFDDGSYIIHFDYGDKTRIIGFKSCMIKDKCMVQKDSVNEVFITRVEFERILRESLDYLKR